MKDRRGQVWEVEEHLMMVVGSRATCDGDTEHDLLVLEGPGVWAAGEMNPGWLELGMMGVPWEETPGRRRVA